MRARALACVVAKAQRQREHVQHAALIGGNNAVRVKYVRATIKKKQALYLLLFNWEW